MICSHAKEHIAASWQGELDPATELSLKQHLAECAECAGEMAILGGIWERLGDLPAPEPGYALNVRWRSTLESLIASQERAAQAKPVRNWRFLWQAGFAMACLLAGFFFGRVSVRGNAGSDLEIAKLHEEVALALLQQESATERLRGVDYSGRMRTMEPDVVSALVEAVNHDPSVNVRLAAIDALGKTTRNAEVLDSLTHSLATQDSPMVQATLVDYLADAHDRHAVGALRQLAQEPDLNPAVLERTRSALRQLSQ